MDMHRTLNSMQGELSQENIDGALTYLLEEGDRVLVRAFMAGVNRTAPLKFDHPGQGTTATRMGSRLVIQNDIGMTDAHVLVVNIESISVQKVISHEAPLVAGISASSGVASGRIAFTVEVAERFSADGPVILVREMVTPDDIQGITICAGILTARGARTSHAAVVARQMGKVCIVNCTDLEIDILNHKCMLGGRELSEGALITLDGNAGLVYLDHGKVEVLYEKPLALIEVVKSWGAI